MQAGSTVLLCLAWSPRLFAHCFCTFPSGRCWEVSVRRPNDVRLAPQDRQGRRSRGRGAALLAGSAYPLSNITADEKLVGTAQARPCTPCDVYAEIAFAEST